MSSTDRQGDSPFLSSHGFHWTLMTACSIFFVLFLVLFLPFGVNEPKKEFNLVFLFQMSLFGWIIFFTWLANDFLLRRRFITNWTTRVFVGWIAWCFFSAGTMNFLLYNYLQSWYDMYWSSYVLHVLNVGTVLIFPVVGVYYYYHQREMKEQLRQLSQVKGVKEVLSTPVTIPGSADLEKITLEIQQLLYIESDDNYAILHYLDHGQRKKHIIRNTLTALESADYAVSFLLRIHRSYLVNAYLVESIRGNVQRSKIKLRHLPDTFPVSRTYVHAVRARLQELSV